MAGTLGPLHLLQDGSFAICVDSTTYINNRTLTAGAAEAVAVPAGAKFAVFGGDVSFAVRYNATGGGTAAAFADVTDGGGCEINPTIRYFNGPVAELSIISAANGNVSVTFYK